MRRLAGTRKVGHAGTLDPMATGVLVVGVERATRLLGHLALTDKAYDATIRLGVTTVTDDAEGEAPVAVVDASHVTDEAIAAGVRALTGAIEQRPSAVSAIKVDGVRCLRPRAVGRGGRARRPARDGVALRRARRCAATPRAVPSSTSTSRWSAARAPTSGPWRATSAPVSASAVT